MFHLESIFIIDSIFISMGIKDLGQLDKTISIIGKVYCPLPLGHVRDPILSWIDVNSNILIILDGIHKIICILSSEPDHLNLQISIWWFPMAGNIVKCQHIGSIIITRVEDVDEESLSHQLITTIE